MKLTSERLRIVDATTSVFGVGKLTSERLRVVSATASAFGAVKLPSERITCIHKERAEDLGVVTCGLHSYNEHFDAGENVTNALRDYRI